MTNIRFYYDDIWENYVIGYSTQHVNWPASNTQQRWITRSWRSNHGVNSGWGRFVITVSNQNLYYDEGGGQITVQIPIGVYDADTLAQAIEDALNTSGVSGSCDYEIYYDDANNRFVIATDPSCVFELICTNTTNAIWDTIGFNTSADTGFDSIHIADYIRIHTEEYIYIDAGVGNTISACAAFVAGHNLQAEATFKIQFSNDNFTTIPIDWSMTRSTARNMFVRIFGVIHTYRYARFYIQDVDNSDGYIELGRAWLSCCFEPRIGFSPDYSRIPLDPSLKKESEGGQISTIQRTYYRRRDYGFDLVTGETEDTREDFDAMFDDRGASLELFILEKPSSSTEGRFLNPENNTIYCHFRNWRFKHIAGLAYSLKLSVQEER